MLNKSWIVFSVFCAILAALGLYITATNDPKPSIFILSGPHLTPLLYWVCFSTYAVVALVLMGLFGRKSAAAAVLANIAAAIATPVVLWAVLTGY